jgi:phage anti-repressor protein
MFEIQDFAVLAKTGESKNNTDYHLTLDMAKEINLKRRVRYE